MAAAGGGRVEAAPVASPRAVAAWAAACLAVLLSTGSPAYRSLVLVDGVAVVLAAVGPVRGRRLLVGAGLAGLSAAVLNAVVSHVGGTVLVELPDAIPVVGGPYTLEAVAFGLASGVTLAAALLAVAPLSLLVEAEDIVDALPPVLARTGAAVAAALNLVPRIAAGFSAVAEAQRMRGWRPRGPRSWAEVVVVIS